MFTTPFDPAYHQLVHPAALDAYRRETGFPSLVAYRHREHGRFVLAFRSDDASAMMEVGYLNEEEPENPIPSQDAFHRVVKRLRAWASNKEILQQFKRDQAGMNQERVEGFDRTQQAIEAMYRHIRRTQGGHKADQYLHATGRKLTGPGIRVGT